MAKPRGSRVSKNPKLYTLKVKTESNNLGFLKTLLIMVLIAIQTALMILSSLYLLGGFKYYGMISIILSIIACIHVLSSTQNGQTKATWIIFLLSCYTFGFLIYLLSNEKILFAKSRKKYAKIYKKSIKYIKNNNILNNLLPANKRNCEYLNNFAFSSISNTSKINYFASGTRLFDEILLEIKKAKKFIFIEFFIISDGVLLKRFLDILKQKASDGVDVRIIYDDMGCHGKLKHKTKKEIKKAGIQLQHFNRLLPVFNLALNLRDHRKLVIVDGRVGFTGGANLADEYVNEKQIYGYWKDEGVKIEGDAIDNFTIAYLRQWEFITNEETNYENYINLADSFETDSVVVPFVSGPEFKYSISKDMFLNIIADADEVINIMTPYFIPEETIINLLIAKAKSGVKVNLVLPGIADKKLVYVVSRDYAERLIASNVKVYTMVNSFVHSKVLSNENSAIIGSINLDHRSFNQQFESAVYTNDRKTIDAIEQDFKTTIMASEEITPEKRKRNKLMYRLFAGILRLISPFM